MFLENFMSMFKKAVSMDPLSYQEQDPLHREHFHKQSIYNLEKTLSQQPKAVGPLCDWIASHHELALIYQERGAIESAQKCLLIPHQAMLYMAQNCYGDEEQRLIAVNAIGITLPPLMEFAKTYPPCQCCMDQLNAQLDLINNHTKQYH
jgi:hypothetical protein